MPVFARGLLCHLRWVCGAIRAYGLDEA